MKMILNLTSQLVIDSTRALKVLELLEDAEVYESRWRNKEDGGSTYHIFPLDSSRLTVTGMSNNQYAMYKLAGKPE